MASYESTPKRGKMCIAALAFDDNNTAPVVGIATRVTQITEFESQSQFEPGRCQRFSFVLTDDTADIRVTVFGRDLGSLREDVCREGQAVRLAGARVRSAKPEYNNTQNKLELTVSIGDKSRGSIVLSNDQVERRAAVYLPIRDLGDVMAVNKMVDVMGTISSVEKAAPTMTQHGKNIDLAKVRLVDQSGSSVSCVFWASSAGQVNDWAIGEILSIRGASAGKYSGEVTLNCSRAEVRHAPDDLEAQAVQEWYNSCSTEQDFEPVRPSQALAVQHDEARDEMVVHCSKGMLSEYKRLLKIRFRFGAEEVVFIRTGQQMKPDDR